MFFCMSCTANAGETLESILAASAQQPRVLINYREIRHLRLLNRPWQAKGRMFITKNTIFIAQIFPERELLTANKTRFWLYIPNKGIRRTGTATSPIARKTLGLFEPIMRGDKAAVEKAFNFQVSETDKVWQLDLQPKRIDKALYAHIIVKGKKGRAASYMMAAMPDGDFTEWFFVQHEFGPNTEGTLKKLMKEAKGF